MFQASLAERSVRLFNFFRPSPASSRSADTAKERLQVLLAIERHGGSGPNFLPQLQDEILQVIKKYVEIDNDKVTVEVDRRPEVSMLGINIELPAAVKSKVAPAQAAMQGAT
jgi:cell division topological specificity factor